MVKHRLSQRTMRNPVHHIELCLIWKFHINTYIC
jgi:hypothetical protein